MSTKSTLVSAEGDEYYTDLENELMQLCVGGYDGYADAAFVVTRVRDPSVHDEKEQSIVKLLDQITTDDERTQLLDLLGDDPGFYHYGYRYVLFAFAYLVQQGGSISNNVPMLQRVIERFGGGEFALGWYEFMLQHYFQFQLTEEQTKSVRRALQNLRVNDVLRVAVERELAPLIRKYGILPEFKTDQERMAYEYVEIEESDNADKTRLATEYIEKMPMGQMPLFIRCLYNEMRRRAAKKIADEDM